MEESSIEQMMDSFNGNLKQIRLGSYDYISNARILVGRATKNDLPQAAQMSSDLETALREGAPIIVNEACAKLPAGYLTLHQFMDTEFNARDLISRGYCSDNSDQIDAAVAAGIESTFQKLVNRITAGDASYLLFREARQVYGVEKFVLKYDDPQTRKLENRMRDAVTAGANKAYDSCLARIAQGTTNRDQEEAYAQKLIDEHRLSRDRLSTALNEGARPNLMLMLLR